MDTLLKMMGLSVLGGIVLAVIVLCCLAIALVPSKRSNEQ